MLAQAREIIPGRRLLPAGSAAEMKFDGYRCLVFTPAGPGEGVILQSRRGALLQDRFPDLVAAAGQLPHGLVLDGELLVMAGDDLSFEALQRRTVAGSRTARALARASPACFVAFDVLQARTRRFQESWVPNDRNPHARPRIIGTRLRVASRFRDSSRTRVTESVPDFQVVCCEPRRGSRAPPAVARHPDPVPMTAASVPRADITVDGTGPLWISLLLRLRKQIRNAEPGAGVHVIAKTRPPRSTCPPGAAWPATPTSAPRPEPISRRTCCSSPPRPCDGEIPVPRKLVMWEANQRGGQVAAGDTGRMRAVEGVAGRAAVTSRRRRA
ncbi:hypothetical protein PV679_34235 [Streptomyces sp. AK02-01A]|nr:hypothetical protein [Streptomyces sp. AK02-01A]